MNAPLRELPVFFLDEVFIPVGLRISKILSFPYDIYVIKRLAGQEGQKTIVLIPEEKKEDFYQKKNLETAFGIESSIYSIPKTSSENFLVEFETIKKVRITSLKPQGLLYVCQVEDVEEYGAPSLLAERLRMDIIEIVYQLLKYKALDESWREFCAKKRDYARFADSFIYSLKSIFGEKMRRKMFLEINISKRLRIVFDKLQDHLEEIRITEKADQKMAEQEKRIRLTQRKRSIENELAKLAPETKKEKNDAQESIAEEINEAGMPPEILKIAQRELSRLHYARGHLEENMIRRYLDYLCLYPWNKATEDRGDLSYAREILDKKHYGLESVKKRVLEFLAIRNLNPKKRGAILCFNGPPGTGKTSIAKSIALALGRKMAKMSLGGIKDEAEIRGHRRTYIGALPGRIAKAMIDAGAKNPVIILDEIDKIAAGNMGDPSAALLEVLDPEQNYAFSDHYFEVDLDLSRVVFIATSNYEQNIMRTLRDRLELIDFPGYTEEEKLNIARCHLLPKQIEEHGLLPYGIEFSEEVLRIIINEYTSEAGVRNVEREIAAVLRSRAAQIAGGEAPKNAVEKEELADILGPPRYGVKNLEELAARPGIVSSLIATPFGGEVIIIESLKMPPKGEAPELVVTGKLGEVMRESALVALSCAKAYLRKMGIDNVLTYNLDLHLHCDDHEKAKDGSSVGAAIALCFISLLSGKRVRNDLALMGEITLRGHLWPAAAIKHKILAAHRAGYKYVFIPLRNEKDLVEIPENVKKDLDIMLAEYIEDIVDFALI